MKGALHCQVIANLKYKGWKSQVTERLRTDKAINGYGNLKNYCDEMTGKYLPDSIKMSDNEMSRNDMSGTKMFSKKLKLCRLSHMRRFNSNIRILSLCSFA
jgi:hypothetical protein